MKNKSQIIFHFIILINLFIAFYSLSEEIKFEANSIEIIDKDKKIIAKKNVKIFNEREIIYADEMDYDKFNQIIKAKGNVRIENAKDNIKILSDELNYTQKNDVISLNLS